MSSDAGDIPPARMMVRALQALKKDLEAVGINATLNSMGPTKADLRVRHDICVTCRTNREDDHAWWFWLNNEAIASIEHRPAAVEAIKGAVKAGTPR